MKCTSPKTKMRKTQKLHFKKAASTWLITSKKTKLYELAKARKGSTCKCITQRVKFYLQMHP